MGQTRLKRKATATMSAETGHMRYRSTEIESPQPQDDNLNPTSCEICRQRKCKCDRKFPFCSQCANEPSKCIYPESGKRGLPLGYLNQLEQRLAETESALYGALATLHFLGQTTAPVSKLEVPKHKAARMEEWSQLPLREWTDMEYWMQIMSVQFPGQPITANYAMPKPGETPKSTYAWQGDKIDGVTENPYETHQKAIISPLFQGMDEGTPLPGNARQGIKAVEDTVGVSEVRNTRAEDLSHQNPSLYF